MIMETRKLQLKNWWKKYHRLIITLGSASFILLGTLIAIQVAKGYRPTKEGTLKGTGLLALNSDPKGALVYIDGELIQTLTDSTITLNPGNYLVEITMEGFSRWSKNLRIDKELVTATNAELFRTVPSLNPLTFSGAANLIPSPDGQKIAFAIASPSAQLKAGLYILELSDRNTLFSKTTRLVAQNPKNLDFTQAKILWSPDSNQLLASFPSVNYLLNPNQTTNPQDLVDASSQLTYLLTNWEQEITNREKQLLSSLPEAMIEIATQSAKNLYFSPDSEKLLYTAIASAQIPEGLTPPLPVRNSQPENRNLEAGNLYVYDIKEDQNFLLLDTTRFKFGQDFTKIALITELFPSRFFSREEEATSSASLLLRDSSSLAQTIENFRGQYSSFPFTAYQWFPTSRHILIHLEGSVAVIEYDGTNLINLFSGVSVNNFIYPWPNGHKLVIHTNLTQNPLLPPNLYAINLK